MQFFRDRQELHGDGLSGTPNADRFADIGVAAEIHEQADHSADVVRMVSPLQETLTRRRNIRFALEQLQSRFGVADRDPHGPLEELIVFVEMGNAVPIQMEDRILLRLGPKSFAADVSPQGRKRMQREQQNE